ncbi:MAG: alpha-L-fucosidase [Promethearchaeota archaeon]
MQNQGELPLPTSQQMQWADCEIGVLIHFDIQVFEPKYKFRKQWGYTPNPKIFDPAQLDTDQWIKTAKEAGATYAILTAKHCSGFCLWPSKDYRYSTTQCSYKDGKGDIVGEFIASCRKFGLKPGLYYSTGCNAFMKFDMGNRMPDQSSSEYKQYSQLVEQQLRELWSNYGELFEIWFDGGHFPGGPDIPQLLKELQPNAICFQGPSKWTSNLRWVGNERGHAPYPCWSTISDVSHYDGTKEIGNKHKGNPEGQIWMPAETDTPNRNFQWMWYKNQEYLVVPAEKLLKFYYNSVGRNSNVLLGMVIDNRGLVPDRDVREFKKFGNYIRERFGTPIKEISGEGNEFAVKFNKETKINQIIIQEDIQYGERVQKFRVEGKTGINWEKLCEGSCIGHKFIKMIKSHTITQVRLTIEKSRGIPKIRKFALFNVHKMPKAKPFLFRLIGINQ